MGAFTPTLTLPLRGRGFWVAWGLRGVGCRGGDFGFGGMRLLFVGFALLGGVCYGGVHPHPNPPPKGEGILGCLGFMGSRV